MVLVQLDPNNKTNCILSNNNMSVSFPGGGGGVKSTQPKSSGKWYWEITFDSAWGVVLGVATPEASTASCLLDGQFTFYCLTGEKFYNTIRTTIGNPISAGIPHTVGIAADLISGVLSLYIDGLYNCSFTIPIGTYYAYCSWGASAASTAPIVANLGDTPFKYSIPVGYESYSHILDNNFQHYAIILHNKYYILKEKYFDITKMEFASVTLTDLYDFESEISDKQLEVKNIFNPIMIQNKMIYPLDCFKSTSGMRIMKIVGSSSTYPGMNNNNKVTYITLKSNFINLYKSTLIKFKDVIKLKFNELKYFVTINNSSTLKVGIESNSILYGENFKIINEDDIIAKGFDAQDFNKLEIPFDNVRFIFAFKDICTNSNDELKYIKITKSNDYLKRPLLINKDYMSVVDKQTNNLYIKLLDNFSSIIVNRIENKDKILKATNTMDIF